MDSHQGDVLATRHERGQGKGEEMGETGMCNMA